MKKLLLTLLGAAALCGLSPHAAAEEPASANVLHMDFNKRTADHNQDLHFYGKLQTITSSSATTAATVCTFYNPDSRFEWPTAAAGVKVTQNTNSSPSTTTHKYTYSSFPAYNAEANYDGVKYIENDQLKLELNYMWAIAKDYTQSNTYKTHFTSQIRITDDGGALYLYPGVTFKITAKNGKKIKKIILKTPYNSNYFTSARRKEALFVYKTPEGDDFSLDNTINTASNATTIQRTATVTDGTYQLGSLSCATIEITLPETYPGENADIVLGLKKDGLKPWNFTGTAPYNFAAIKASSSGSTINTLREPFGISAIDVEYYGDDELPKFVKTLRVGNDVGDQIKIKQGNEYIFLSDFEGTYTDNDVVNLKLGDAFIEVTRASTLAADKHTVTFDKTKGWIGVHAYSTIRTWLDPDKYQYKGQNATASAALPYKMTYIVNGNVGQTTRPAATESRINTGSNTSLLTGENKFENTASNLKSNEICYIKNLNGISSDLTLTASTTAGTWGVPTSQATSTSSISGQSGAVKSGTLPAFVFDGLEFIYPSDAPNAPLPASVTADFPETEPGVYRSSTPFNISLASQKDDYDNHTIEYLVSDTKLDKDAIKWSEATSSTDAAKIEITSSKFVYARISSVYEDGKTYNSSPVEITATILQPDVKIANLADLHKAENDGKVVLLQMPLIVTNNTSVYPQSQADGYTQAAYLRDINGIGVKAVSRRKASTDPSFPDKSYGQESPTYNKVVLMPENTVAGLYLHNDGKNPCIVIRDLINEPATDYYDYQGNTTVEITDAAPYKDLTLAEARRYPTDGEYTTLTSNLYGKKFFIRGLDNWNETDKSFNVAAADEDDPLKTIRLRVGNTIKGALGILTTLPTIKADKIYDIQGILEYDPEGNDGQGEYFLAPINIYEQFDIPKLIGPETIKDKIKEIYDENDPTKVIGYEYTDDFKDGLINLELQMEGPTTGTTPYNYYWSIVKEDGSSLCTSNHQGITVTNYKTNTDPKPNLTTSQLTFDQETGTTTIYAYCYERGNFNNTNSGRRLKIVIRDAVQSGPEVVSIEDFRTKLQSGELNADKPVYVKFDGRFAVTAIYGNTVILRDVDNNLPLDPANADADRIKDSFSNSYIVISDENRWDGFNVNSSRYEGNHLWGTYSRSILVGDEVKGFIGKVSKDTHGNVTVNLAGLQTFFSANALNEHVTPETNPDAGSYRPNTSVAGFDYKTPRFIPYMTTGKKDENGEWIIDANNPVTHPVNKALSEIPTDPLYPNNVTFDNSMLDTELHVMNVAVREKKSDDPDAEKDYEAIVTTDGLTLLWDMFETDLDPADAPATAAENGEESDKEENASPALSVKKQLAAHLTNGEKAFNILGVLRKYDTTDDGVTTEHYALQVEDLEPTPKDSPARFFADGEEIEGGAYEFVKRVDITTDTPDEALIKMTIDEGEQLDYDPEKLKNIEADTKVTIERWVPGTIKTLPTTVTLTKLSTDVNTLAEMAQGTNAKDLYHFRKHLKVVAADEGTVMAADAEGHLAVVQAAPADAEEGKYLTDVVLVRSSNNSASIHEIDADAELLDEEDSYAIATPEPTTLFGAVIKDGKAVENEGQGASYAIDPTFEAIPTADAEGWKLTGYVLPGADSNPVIYLTAAQALDRVALPDIKPAEAAFLDRTTVTIDCATTGAAIEYSTDGGNTWLPYTTAFDVEATGTILARATAEGMLPSRQAEASVVREFLSGDVIITVDQQEGKTVITITGPGKIYYSIDGAAEKQYDGAITIANDTQTELSGTIRAYALEDGKRPGTVKEESYKVSGIAGIGADGEADGVSVEGNSIIVPQGAQTFDIAGRRVNPTSLPRGIYIVRLASGKAVKVVVK